MVCFTIARFKCVCTGKKVSRRRAVAALALPLHNDPTRHPLENYNTPLTLCTYNICIYICRVNFDVYNRPVCHTHTHTRVYCAKYTVDELPPRATCGKLRRDFPRG